MDSFNKNDRQRTFNQIKGSVHELIPGEKFCSITLNVGHENVRQVNLIIKKQDFETLTGNLQTGDKVACTFYVTSKLKNDRWHTMVNVLDIEQESQ